MELPFLQNEVTSFLRQHKGSRFSKRHIAVGVAEHLIETQRSNQSVVDLAEDIFNELKKHQLRTWPKITRQALVAH